MFSYDFLQNTLKHSRVLQLIIAWLLRNEGTFLHFLLDFISKLSNLQLNFMSIILQNRLFQREFQQRKDFLVWIFTHFWCQEEFTKVLS